MMSRDMVLFALQVATFACGAALLSHRFYAAYQGWSVHLFSWRSHLPGIIGIALMFFAVLGASSLGWAYAVATVVVGFAVSYLYVYVLRLRIEVALLGLPFAGLSVLGYV